MDDLKVAAEEGEDPMALLEPRPLEGDALRDGTVTPETPIKATPPVVVLPPPASDNNNATGRGRRRGTHDITASSPRLSPEHPITVTPPTPGMLLSIQNKLLLVCTLFMVNSTDFL